MKSFNYLKNLRKMSMIRLFPWLITLMIRNVINIKQPLKREIIARNISQRMRSKKWVTMLISYCLKSLKIQILRLLC